MWCPSDEDLDISMTAPSANELDKKMLASLYALFSILATVANILAQDIAFRICNCWYGVPFSIFVGTCVGLVLKYFLDKRYIFRFRARNVAHDAMTFALYTLMGLATTIIFLCFEFAFHYIFETKRMRYLGGVLGLAIGYLIKFHLDKRYVFRIKVV